MKPDSIRVAHNAAQARYKKTKKGKLTEIKYRRSAIHHQLQARWRAKSKKKMRAHKIFNTAVSKGEIKRKTCEVCGAPNAFGHHDNYSKPLEVRWFCPLHHRRYHLGLLNWECASRV